jgi:hypothetical protein
VNSLITAIVDGAQGGTEPPKPTERYLRLISDEVITIGPTDGRGVILPTGLDLWFEPLEGFYGPSGQINNPSTPETSVQVFEIFKGGGGPSEVFGSLGRDMNSLCLTPDQVVRFVLDNIRLFLENGSNHETFFLYKVGVEIRVAGASRESGMFFIYWNVWPRRCFDFSYGNRVIIPKP